jgi:hypothetical protein
MKNRRKKSLRHEEFSLDDPRAFFDAARPESGKNWTISTWIVRENVFVQQQVALRMMALFGADVGEEGRIHDLSSRYRSSLLEKLDRGAQVLCLCCDHKLSDQSRPAAMIISTAFANENHGMVNPICSDCAKKPDDELMRVFANHIDGTKVQPGNA